MVDNFETIDLSETAAAGKRSRVELLAVSLLVVFLMTSGVLTFAGFRRLLQNRLIVQHTNEVLLTLEQTTAAIQDAETGQRGYLITGRDEYLAPFESAVQRIDQKVDQLQRLVPDNEAQQMQVAKLQTAISDRIDELRIAIAARRDHGSDPARAAFDTDVDKKTMDRIRGVISEMRDVELALLKSRELVARQSYRNGLLTSVLTTLLTLALVGLVLLIVTRSRRRAELAVATVQAQRERLRVTLASIGDAVISTDTQGQITSLNAVAESLTGWANDQAIGHSLTDVFQIINETTRLPVENPALRAIASGVIVGLANHTILIGKQGMETFIDDSAAPIRDATGKVIGCVLVFRDIGARKLEEQQQLERQRLVTLRADVSDAIAGTHGTSVALQKVCEAFVNHLQVAFARIWTVDEAQAVLELKASAGMYTHLDGPHCRVPVGEYKIGRIAGNRRPHLTNSVCGDPEVSDQEWAKKEGMVAFAGYPLLLEDRVVGVVAMFSRQPLSDGVISDLAPLADAIAQFIDRRQTEQQNRMTRSRLQSTLTASEIGTWEFDVAANTVWADENLARMFQVDPEDAAGGRLDAYLRDVHPDDLQRVMSTIQRAIDHEDSYEAEYRLVHADGTQRWVEARGRVERDSDGTAVRLPGVVLDITARKRVEEQLRESQDQLRMTLESAEVGTWHIYPETMGFEADERFHAIFGRPGQSMTYHDAIDCIADEDREHVLASVAESIRADDPKPYAVEHRIVLLDGSLRWVFAKGRANFEGGRVLSFDGTVTDITDRKRVDELIRDAESQFRLLADHIPQLAWIPDAGSEGQVNWYNQNWYDYTGTTFNEMQGTGWQKLMHPDHAQRVIAKFVQHVRDCTEWEDTFPLRGKDGRYRWFLSRMNVIRNEAGQVTRMFGTNTDIDEQLQMAETLRQTALQLSEADQRKDEFLATLAHELRNPLAPIKNAVQLMAMTPLNEETEELRQTMARQVEQLVRLIDDLLDVSRISRGKIVLRREVVDLAAIVDAAVEASTTFVNESGQSLTVDCPRDLIFVDVDPARITQVISNLLNNSAKYSDAGSQIQLAVGVDNGMAVIRVRDDGIGIAADRLDEIFQMFSQISDSLERGAAGLGIGLTLVKTLVEMHGGTVAAFSEGLGLGSLFSVTLPVVDNTHQRELPKSPATAGSSQSFDILIVEDQRALRFVLTRLLEKMGHRVESADCGLAALDKLDGYVPDIIFSDVSMPGMTGYELVAQLRKRDALRGTYFVAMTGFGQESDREQATQSGFHEHMVKPVDVERLHELFAKLSADSQAT